MAIKGQDLREVCELRTEIIRVNSRGVPVVASSLLLSELEITRVQ